MIPKPRIPEPQGQIPPIPEGGARRIWYDLGWVALLQPREGRSSVEVQAWEIDGTHEPTAMPFVTSPGRAPSYRSTHFLAWDQVSPNILGSVELTGYSNLMLGSKTENKDGYYWGLDQRNQLTAIGEVLGRLWDEAMYLMTQKDGREWPDVPCPPRDPNDPQWVQTGRHMWVFVSPEPMATPEWDFITGKGSPPNPDGEKP